MIISFAPISNYLLFYGKLCHIIIFWNNFFHSTNMREATIIPQILSIAERVFSCKLGDQKIISKNSNMTPFNIVIIVFRNFFKNSSEVLLNPFSKTNIKVSSAYTVRGTTVTVSYFQYKLN